MRTQGDTKRRRCVKAEFDPKFTATALGGAVLAEKALRSTGLRRLIGEHLPERRAGAASQSASAGYSTLEGVYALLAALLVGGRGIGACEELRADALAREIFGLSVGVPSPATTYRLLCDLAGLVERSQADWYKPRGSVLAALRLDGTERLVARTRRIVPDEPEEASAERLAALAAFVGATARRCAAALPVSAVRLHGWSVVHGDATDLEVEGHCFDAARPGREGGRVERWHTVRLGPLIVAQELGPGNRDEGRAMPGLLEQARPLVRQIVGREAKVLALLDAAYFERAVVDGLSAAPFGWDFIVCANQQRNALEPIALGQPEYLWKSTGVDERRGWVESQVSCFTHCVAGWSAPVTIVARRWREEGELPGLWHTSFLATRIAPGDVPAWLRKRCGGDWASAIWALYGTKQGRENDYKTALCDLGLHHPPSCRLGVNQAFYAIASAAANVAMALRYGAVDKSERGITLWRLRARYFRIAGYLVRTGHTLLVRLSGVAVDALRQTLWRKAFAAAGRL